MCLSRLASCPGGRLPEPRLAEEAVELLDDRIVLGKPRQGLTAFAQLRERLVHW